jgi:hypothetical protein
MSSNEANTIGEKQNLEKSLRYLAAQRHSYKIAKMFLTLEIFLAIPLSIISSIVVFYYPEYKIFSALYGLILSILLILVTEPLQKKYQKQGASIQELFDCYVLSLEWPEWKSKIQPIEEIIYNFSTKYESYKTKFPELKDWYSNEVDVLPINLGRIICQRCNIVYDRRLRDHYSFIICLLLFVSCSIVSVLSILNNFNLQTFVLGIVCPLLPLIIWGAKEYKKHIDVIARLDSLLEFSEKIFNFAINNKSEINKIERYSRSLQDEIYENRNKSPLVPDFLYKILQKTFDIDMKKIVADLVEQGLK